MLYETICRVSARSGSRPVTEPAQKYHRDIESTERYDEITGNLPEPPHKLLQLRVWSVLVVGQEASLANPAIAAPDGAGI